MIADPREYIVFTIKGFVGETYFYDSYITLTILVESEKKMKISLLWRA